MVSGNLEVLSMTQPLWFELYSARLSTFSAGDKSFPDKMKLPLPFRRLALAVLLASFLPATLSAQMGKVFDKLTIKSEILDMDRNYAIYLPPDYESSERDYPVLYLLHGGGDDQTGWVQFGEVLRITDQAI